MIILPIHLIFHFRELLPAKSTHRLLILLLYFADYLMIMSLMGLSMGIVYYHSIFVLTNNTTLESMTGGRQVMSNKRKSI